MPVSLLPSLTVLTVLPPLTVLIVLPVANTSGGNFKDWQNEPDKQIAITKVLFGLFGESIKNAFNQEDESLKILLACQPDTIILSAYSVVG
jgi:hypothetical protein